MKLTNYVLLSSILVVSATIGTFIMPATTASAAALPDGTGVKVFKPCRVTSPGGTTATVVSTRKDVFLRNGTALTITSQSMHQGFIAVKTRVAGRLTTVSITADDTNCLD